jgi:hypothetical protein
MFALFLSDKKCFFFFNDYFANTGEVKIFSEGEEMKFSISLNPEYSSKVLFVRCANKKLRRSVGE